MSKAGAGLFLSLALVVPVIADEASTRPAAPTPAALRKPAAQVDQTYRADISVARDPQAKSALAGKILAAATDEQKLDTKYAMLIKAIQLAIEGDDPQTALKAVEQVDQTWQADGLKLKAQTLGKTLRYLTSHDDQVAFVHLAQPVINQAVTEKRYDIAQDLNDAATTAARRANDSDLITQCIARGAEVVELRTAQSRVTAAFARLKTRPDDAAANTAVGRYECYIEDKWSDGLARLARGSDPMLRTLAARELPENLTAKARIAIADSWWDLSRAEAPIARGHIQLHAASLYKAALADLDGPAKQRVEKRLADFDAANAPKPPPVAAAPTPPAAISNGPIVQSLVRAPEAQQIIQDVLRDFPDVLKDVKQATLLTYHDGSQLNHGEGGSRPIPGSHSGSPAVATITTTSKFIFWGYADHWMPGRYLVVYRMQAIPPIVAGNTGVMDIYTDGNKVGQHTIKPTEMPPGQWAQIPMIVRISMAQNGEFRLYSNEKRVLALDRIYVYALE
jgi:hypothetical protein